MGKILFFSKRVKFLKNVIYSQKKHTDFMMDRQPK